MTIKITGLHSYPVKSLGSISLQSADLLHTGIRHDRSWMAVKPDGTFLTQRTHPQMSLVETSIVDNQLILDTFGMDPHTVPPSDADMARINTKIWGDAVRGIDMGDLTADWLSQAIGEPCRLLAFPASEQRPCDPAVASPNDHTRFADAYPLLVVSEASLADLNGRLAAPVGMARFRPNIVVSGCDAFDEDGWQAMTIGTIRIRMLDRCARCSVPTVDPATGSIAGVEPIRTLNSYRQQDGEVYFGRNAASDGEGVLRVGDEVSVS